MFHTENPNSLIMRPENQDFYTTLGARVHDARVRLGLTRAELAAAAGTNAEQLEQYENAKLELPVYHLIPMVQYMGYPHELDNLPA